MAMRLTLSLNRATLASLHPTSSSERDLRIGTTKFLAFMLFNDWEVPFLLLGVMMVIALQAGVFLAREEKDD